jgi:hypothetical protein
VSLKVTFDFRRFSVELRALFMGAGRELRRPFWDFCEQGNATKDA